MNEICFLYKILIHIFHFLYKSIGIDEEIALKEFFRFEFKTKIFFSVKIFIAQSKSLNQSNLTHGIAIKEIMYFKVKKKCFL